MRDVQGQYTNTLVTLARYLTANGATEAGTRLIPYGGTIFQNALTSLQEALDPSSNAQFKTEDAIETQTVGS